MMMKMMTPGSEDSRVWEFSHEALNVRRDPLGLCAGTYGPLESSGEFLKPSYAIHGRVLKPPKYADHVRFTWAIPS